MEIYEITVKATQDIANVKITLSNILATVTMGGEVKQAKLEAKHYFTRKW